MRRAPLRTLAAALLAAALLAGCGGDEDAVSDAAERFAQAGAVNDYETFCALLTDGAKAAIEDFASDLDAPGEDLCVAGLEAQGGNPEPEAETEVSNVSVDGDTAEALVTNTLPDETVARTLTLEKQDSGDWLVADYGAG